MKKFAIIIFSFLFATRCSTRYSDKLADKGHQKECINDYQNAMRIYNRAIFFNKRSALAFWRRGSLYATEAFGNNYVQAISDYTRSIEIDSTFNSGYAFWNRANAKLEINDSIGALSDYNKAITLGPEQGNFHCYRGILKYQMKDYEGALLDLDNSIKYWENFYLARSYRSTLRLKLGNYAGALEDYDFLDFSEEEENDPEMAREFRDRGIAKHYTNDSIGACRDWLIASKHKDSISLEKIKKYCK